MMRKTRGAAVFACVVVLVLEPCSGSGQQPSSQPPAQAPSSQQQAQSQQQPTTPAPETQSLHILVGRSIIINLQVRLRRVLVANPAVIDTITTSPTQVVVTAKAPGSTSVILWDETGHSRILDVYSDLDVSGLRDSIQQAFPSEQVQVEAEQGRIIVSGTASSPAVADEILKMATAYAKEAAVLNSLIVLPTPHGKQLMLKVRFAEVDRSRLSAFGMNIISTGAANTPGSITTGQFGPPAVSGTLTGKIPGKIEGTTTSFTVSDLLNIFVFRPDLNLATTIRALQQQNVLQILAEPNLMAMNGQPARFLAGGEFPFPVVQGGTNFTAVTIQFRPFGVRLDFTGTIGRDNVVRLKVAPEVSTLDFTNALQISGFTVPAISTRRTETEIELRDGQSFGIAGLLDNRVTQQMSKIPGIGDVPILGNLFRSRSVNKSKTELLVLVTPMIVDPISGQIAAPEPPKMPVTTLDQEKFDKNLGTKNEGAKK